MLSPKRFTPALHCLKLSMISVLYKVSLEGHHIRYRNSSAIELDSGSSVGGSTLMIFRETFLNVTFSGKILSHSCHVDGITLTIGTSIAIYGDSISLRNSSIGPSLDSATNAFIDGIPTKATFFAKSNGGLLYESPRLSEGLHSLSFSNISNVYIDYMFVTPGNQTEILGETLLVDSSDSSLSYEGDWVREDAAQDAEVCIPIATSTMRSNSTGASVSFPFTGKLLNVCGSSFCNITHIRDRRVRFWFLRPRTRQSECRRISGWRPFP